MKTVFVGLSGGVDSAVTAYLLKKEGHKVIGAFIKAWEPPWLPCTSGADRLEAMRVAAHLEIPFRTYDFKEEYKRDVVDYLIAEYREGRTPNPDVMCNRAIKFGAFWQRAYADGADMVATGHYAQIQQGSAGQALYRGADSSKDQSYFLWTLGQVDLEHSLFPVGHLQKGDVRKIAAEAGLPNAKRRDSQGLCFLGHVDMKAFLMRYIPVQRGAVIDEAGKRIGEHDGAAFYTIGERLPIGGHERQYVAAKDVEKNELITTSTSDAPLDVGRQEIELESTNWVRGAPLCGKMYDAQIRYHGEKLSIHVEGGTVRFGNPILAAPGQSLVVYDPLTGECIGGGTIALC